ncbi:hypothetical protein D187_007448 [Cystobacter fuscus DSM 2262]|uniref:PABS domain-containing protein n=1 Tax=Cystobacter fuscus (strain ATCC 25194 / DSM 2262 / NBRC 100088 / M29) TaxID=1242864 RepID=S9NZ44_CYSF2|nr:hypothetical protein D187_007448 [Cystobacter fuscus DSM 2262]
MVHEADSPFGPVYVVDVGDQRSLRFDSPEGTLQSAILKSDPLAVPISYVRVATAGLALTQGRSRLLVVGLGGGSFPMLLHRLLPRRARIDVVELNPVVVDTARRFFGVREDHRLLIHVDEGSRFMTRQGPRYDLIFLDAFSDRGTPDHLKESRAFFEDVRHRLSFGGVAVLNIALEDPRNVAKRIETFASAFEDCAMLRGASQYGNLILVGTLEPLPSEPLFRQRLWRLARELDFPELAESVVSFKRVSG